MATLEKLINEAKRLRELGLSTSQIAKELKLQEDTVRWLLLEEKRKRAVAPSDIFVDWTMASSNPMRLSLIGEALASLVEDGYTTLGMEEPDIIVAVEAEGAPLAAVVSTELGKPLAILKSVYSGEEHGVSLSPSYPKVDGKKALLVADVIGSGALLEKAINYLESLKVRVVGVAAFVDRSGLERIMGVPVNALVKILPIKQG